MKKFLLKIQDLIYGRPLGCSCLFLMILAFLLLFAPTVLKITLILSGTFGFIFFLIAALKGKYHQKRRPFLAVAVAFLLLSLSSASCFLSYDLYDKRVSELAVLEETVTVKGYPVEIIYEENFSSLYVIKVTHLNGKRVFGVRILGEFSGRFAPLYTVYQGTVSLKVPGDTDPSFDEYTYYRKQGIHATAVCEDEFISTGKSVKTPEAFFYDMRTVIGNIIEDHTKVGSAECGLLTALLTADTSKIPDDVQRNFKTLGLSHILAISGMHLSVLFTVFDYILRKFKLSIKPRSIILTIFILFYMGLCGFTLSVVRAGIMLFMFMLSLVVGEPTDTLTPLLLAGGLICLLSPYAIYDCGFLLSFFATLGLLTVGNQLTVRKRMKMKWYQKVLCYFEASLAASLAAQLAVLPIVYDTFGYLSLASPVFTLLLSPIFTAILYIEPFAILFSFIPFFSEILFIPLKHLCKIAVWITDLSSYVSHLTVSIDRKITMIFIAVIILLFFLFFFSEHKRMISLILTASYFVFCGISYVLPYYSKPIAVFAVNNDNDILWLSDAKNESALIDLSNGSFTNQNLALYYTSERTKDRNPETIVLTHYHQRHIATFNRLCMRYYIDQIYLPTPMEQDENVYQSIISIAKNHNIKVNIYDGNSEFEICGYTFFGYDRQYLKRSTHPVFTFCLSRGEECVRYFSSSYPEVAQDNLFQNSNYFGTHGPIIKTRLKERLLSTSSFFASEEVYRDYQLYKKYSDDLLYFEFE